MVRTRSMQISHNSISFTFLVENVFALFAGLSNHPTMINVIISLYREANNLLNYTYKSNSFEQDQSNN